LQSATIQNPIKYANGQIGYLDDRALYYEGAGGKGPWLKSGRAPTMTGSGQLTLTEATPTATDPKRTRPDRSNRKQPPANTERVMRTWTDATGKNTVEAEFRGMVDGKVTLHKADGSEVTLPLEKLSATDQTWIRSPEKRSALDAGSSTTQPMPPEESP
jgi:hypothetical protein